MKSSSEAQYILVRDINIANGAVFVNETLNSDSYHVVSVVSMVDKCVSSTLACPCRTGGKGERREVVKTGGHPKTGIKGRDDTVAQF